MGVVTFNFVNPKLRRRLLGTTNPCTGIDFDSIETKGKSISKRDVVTGMFIIK